MDAYDFLFTKISIRGEIMDKNVEQLVLILNKEHEIYEQISQLADVKKQVIIDGKIKELEETTKKEKTFTLSLVKLESLRSKTVDALLNLYGLVEVDNITDLIKYMTPKEGMAIRTVRDKIMKEVTEIQFRNDQNKKLIEQSLDFIDFNMDLLTTIDDSNEYGSDADEKEKETRSLFDMKV